MNFNVKIFFILRKTRKERINNNKIKKKRELFSFWGIKFHNRISDIKNIE